MNGLRNFIEVLFECHFVIMLQYREITITTTTTKTEGRKQNTQMTNE